MWAHLYIVTQSLINLHSSIISPNTNIPHRLALGYKSCSSLTSGLKDAQNKLTGLMRMGRWAVWELEEIEKGRWRGEAKAFSRATVAGLLANSHFSLSGLSHSGMF